MGKGDDLRIFLREFADRSDGHSRFFEGGGGGRFTGERILLFGGVVRDGCVVLLFTLTETYG